MPKPDHHTSSPAQLQGALHREHLTSFCPHVLLPSGLTSIPARHSYALVVRCDQVIASCRRLPGTYCAPGWWWRLVLAKPMKPGRPRSSKVYRPRVECLAGTVPLGDPSDAV